jgi:hypothetical protein
MKHIINGCPVNLRSLSNEQLDRLISAVPDRLDRIQDEMDSLQGERIRRNNRHLQVVPAISVPVYLRDPA